MPIYLRRFPRLSLAFERLAQIAELDQRAEENCLWHTQRRKNGP